MENKNTIGHVAAAVTILIWGTTFISTKILLIDFKPVEILFYRFVMGLIALFIVCPKRLVVADKKREVMFALAGLCGVSLYYLLENIALTYTLATNVGVIISVAPFFTAVITRIVYRDSEKLRVNFFVGFLSAMAGICLISFGGSGMTINPVGDLLSVFAAFIWACYSVITRKISSYGYSTVQSTRRIFIYGIIFMIPALFVSGFELGLGRFVNPVYTFNIIFLGLGASAMCFVTWNFALKVLGAVKTSVYIYMVPVITVGASMLVLGERVSVYGGIGILLTVAGLLISEMKFSFKKEEKSCGAAE
ncbi:DMT family transporter [Lachnospiraceae bacterium NSJ-143]|nr:DMT family transporter [Lachnospiraceae bacterium NSJ-143]